MKKFFLCLVVLMSIGRVFAPHTQYLCGSAKDDFFSSGTIRGVLSTFPQDKTNADLIARANAIAERKTEEESRALVTLVKKFLKPNFFSLIRLREFYNFLKLADHFSTIEEADLAFSKVPASTYNHYIFGCDVRAFAARLELGYQVEPILSIGQAIKLAAQPNPSTGEQIARRIAYHLSLDVRTATTISEVLEARPLIEAKAIIMLCGEALDGEHVSLGRACTTIAEGMPEERNRALVTLIRETIGSSTYTLKAFHDLLFLANYYPSVEEATSAFSSTPKSFRQGRDECSGEIETEKFARSIGLVFVPNNRVLPVEEVTRVIEQENAMLNNANTLEKLFQALEDHRSSEHEIDMTILNIPSTFSRFQTIVMRKTAEENQKLTKLIQVTMQRMRASFSADCGRYMDLSSYSPHSACRYLEMADYYASVEEAEQAFATVTKPTISFDWALGLELDGVHDKTTGNYIHRYSSREEMQRREKLRKEESDAVMQMLLTLKTQEDKK